MATDGQPGSPAAAAGVVPLTAEGMLLQLQGQVQAQQEHLVRQEQIVNAMQGQLNEATTRMQRAEEERNMVLKLVTKKTEDLIDSKGVGQPFKFSGKTDQDFSEWNHKFKTFMRAKYGDEVDKLLNWAVKQRRVIVKDNLPYSDRQVAWSEAFGDNADLTDQIDNIDSMVGGLMAYLVSFTTGEANKVVRNAGSDGVEAWRRLLNEFDPTSAMRRVVILGMVQNPQKCQKVEDLGACLEDWLSKKRQYEEFTDSQGNQCKVSDDSLMAGLYKLMPESLEETVMFKQDELNSFEALFDKLSSFATVRHSLQLSRRDLSGGGSSKPKRDPDAMDIGAVSKGKGKGGKGKSPPSGKGSSYNKMTCYKCGKAGHKAADCRSGGGGKKGDKGAKRLDNVQCWNCFKYGHYGKDCWSKKADDKGKGKGGGKKGKQKGQTNSVDTAQPEKEPELSHLDLCPLDEDYRTFVGNDGQEYVEVPVIPRSIFHRHHPGQGGEASGSGGPSSSAADAAPAHGVAEVPEVPEGRAFRADASRSRDCGRSRSRPRYEESQSEVTEVQDADHGSMSEEVEAPSNPDYMVRWNGEDWIRLNYDSGAVSTVIPVEMARDQGMNLRRVGDYRVANGDRIPRYGRVRVPCVDEQGGRRGFKATITHVHKPLGSAGEFSENHDAYIFKDGGFLVARDSPMAQSIRQHIEECKAQYGMDDVVELHKEGNLYNIYLKQRGNIQEINAFDNGSPSTSPNERQG
eukprot:s170_g7.t1